MIDRTGSTWPEEVLVSFVAAFVVAADRAVNSFRRMA